MKTILPITMSDIHVHLEARHVETLFGQGHVLTHWYDLAIPGQFACRESVEVVGPKGRVAGAVVVGPPRRQTQVEISLGNAFVLGIDPPLRESGRLEGTPGATLVGTAGKVELESGVIAAVRHIHMHPRDAREYAVEMHVDVEEGRPAGVKDFQLVELLR